MNCSSNPNGNIRSETLKTNLSICWTKFVEKERWGIYSQAYSERYWSRARVDKASERSHFQRIVHRIQMEISEVKFYNFEFVYLLDEICWKRKMKRDTLRHILRDIGAEHVLTKPQNVSIFNESFIESKWKYPKWNFKNKFVYLLDEICWKRKMRRILSGIFWEILEQSTCWRSLKTFPFSTNRSKWKYPKWNFTRIFLFVGRNLLKKKDEAYTPRHILRDIGAEHVLTKPQNVPIFNESFVKSKWKYPK